MSGDPNAKSPHDAFYYYSIDQLQAVRSGKWKLHLSRQDSQRTQEGEAQQLPVRLYDLKTDIGETTNVAADHPAVVKRLLALAELAGADLGDGQKQGKHQRPAGFVEKPKPLTN
ncbi:hypothetical protein MYX75_10270 [Acidobacteria bacterium AH-259-A15]|nr:hypothetical protein [Acidobacteria bacterium AH-259-A15]